MSDDSPDPFLLRFVEGRDVDCPGCGYNVRDLRASRCPECGQQLEVSLRLVEPRQGLLIAGLVGLASGLGLGGLLLIYGLIVSLSYGRPSQLGLFFLINAIGFAVHGLAVWIWVRRWNAIRRLSSYHRKLLVVACWTMPLTFVVIFAKLIR